MAPKRYRGQNPFLKALYEDHTTMKRYNFSWFVRNPADVSKPLYSGSTNFRCYEKDKNKRIMELLELVKRTHKLPSIEVIYFAVRRVQR